MNEVFTALALPTKPISGSEAQALDRTMQQSISSLKRDFTTLLSRREVLQRGTAGFSYLAFSALAASAAPSPFNPLAPKQPPFQRQGEAREKRPMDF